MAFGNVSEVISEMEDDEILRQIGADSYKGETQDILIKNIRTSDRKTRTAKSDYGKGISVKGILVNTSGFHFLHRIEMKSESGKDWDSSACLQPDSNVKPLQTSSFFHAKRDAAATGSRAGFTYQVLDKDSHIKGYISFAWENPWDHNLYSFRYCVKVSKNKDSTSLKDCLKHCGDQKDSEITGDVTIKTDEGDLKKFISVDVIAQDETTSYILISIKTDDMVREVYGEL
jgi:hypothetical protein